jgi:hypothetical protein
LDINKFNETYFNKLNEIDNKFNEIYLENKFNVINYILLLNKYILINSILEYGNFPPPPPPPPQPTPRNNFRTFGRFPFNGLTGQTRILFSISMERPGLCQFLKYLAKMDLIQMLSKFSGQISPKPKCFVFHSTI